MLVSDILAMIAVVQDLENRRERIKWNKKQCKYLIGRIKNLKDILEDLKDYSHEEQKSYEKTLNDLANTITGCSEYIKRCIKKNWFRTVINSVFVNHHSEEIIELGKQITDGIIMLTLALQANNKEINSKHQKDSAEKFEEINKSTLLIKAIAEDTKTLKNNFLSTDFNRNHKLFPHEEVSFLGWDRILILSSTDVIPEIFDKKLIFLKETILSNSDGDAFTRGRTSYTAYWNENDQVEQKLFDVSALGDLIDELPKPGEDSTNAQLIEKVKSICCLTSFLNNEVSLRDLLSRFPEDTILPVLADYRKTLDECVKFNQPRFYNPYRDALLASRVGLALTSEEKSKVQNYLHEAESEKLTQLFTDKLKGTLEGYNIDHELQEYFKRYYDKNRWNLKTVINKAIEQAKDTEISKYMNENEEYFKGKILDFPDTKNNKMRSLSAEILDCKKNNMNIEFLLCDKTHQRLKMIIRAIRKENLEIELETTIDSYEEQFFGSYLKKRLDSQLNCLINIKRRYQDMDYSIDYLPEGSYKVTKKNCHDKKFELINIENPTERYSISISTASSAENNITYYYEQASFKERKFSLDDLNQYIARYEENCIGPVVYNTNQIQIKPKEPNKNEIKSKKLNEMYQLHKEIVVELSKKENLIYVDQILEHLAHNSSISDDSVTQWSDSVPELVASKFKKILKINKDMEEDDQIHQNDNQILTTLILETSFALLLETRKESLVAIGIMKRLTQASLYLESIKNKDLILFLGDTGSGKSTSVNYLSGIPLVMDKRGPVRSIKIDPTYTRENFAKISTSMGISETVFIKGYVILEELRNNWDDSEGIKFENIFLCDCPGFNDTRGLGYDLSAALSIYRAAKQACSIKTVVLVIPYSDFFSGKGKAIVDAFEKLEEILQGFDNLPNDVIRLIISHGNDSQKDERNFGDIIEKFCTEKAESFYKEINNETLSQRNKIWHFIRKLFNEKKVLFIDVEDMDQQTKYLDSSLRREEGISKERFAQMIGGDITKRAFGDCMHSSLYIWGTLILRRYKDEIPQKIREIEKIIQDKENEKEAYNKRNQILRELIQEKNAPPIANTKNLVRENSKKISLLLEDNQTKRRRLSDECTQILEEMHQFEEQYEKLSTGTVKQTFAYFKPAPNDTLTCVKKDKIKTAYDEMRALTPDDQESWQVNGNYDGEKLHYLFIQSEYCIVPEEEACKEFFKKQQVNTENGNYIATLTGHSAELCREPGYAPKASADRRSIIYIIKTTWKPDDNVLPWFSIEHVLPNKDVNKQAILNIESEITRKKAVLYSKRKELDFEKAFYDSSNSLLIESCQEIENEQVNLEISENEQKIQKIQNQIVTNKIEKNMFIAQRIRLAIMIPREWETITCLRNFAEQALDEKTDVAEAINRLNIISQGAMGPLTQKCLDYINFYTECYDANGHNLLIKNCEQLLSDSSLEELRIQNANLQKSVGIPCEIMEEPENKDKNNNFYPLHKGDEEFRKIQEHQKFLEKCHKKLREAVGNNDEKIQEILDANSIEELESISIDFVTSESIETKTSESIEAKTSENFKSNAISISDISLKEQIARRLIYKKLTFFSLKNNSNAAIYNLKEVTCNNTEIKVIS